MVDQDLHHLTFPWRIDCWKLRLLLSLASRPIHGLVGIVSTPRSTQVQQMVESRIRHALPRQDANEIVANMVFAVLAVVDGNQERYTIIIFAKLLEAQRGNLIPGVP